MPNNKQNAICIPKQMLSSFTDLVLFKQNRKCMQSITRHIHSVIVITVHNFKEKMKMWVFHVRDILLYLCKNFLYFYHLWWHVNVHRTSYTVHKVFLFLFNLNQKWHLSPRFSNSHLVAGLFHADKEIGRHDKARSHHLNLQTCLTTFVIIRPNYQFHFHKVNIQTTTEQVGNHLAHSSKMVWKNND